MDWKFCLLVFLQIFRTPPLSVKHNNIRTRLYNSRNEHECSIQKSVQYSFYFHTLPEIEEPYLIFYFLKAFVCTFQMFNRNSGDVNHEATPPLLPGLGVLNVKSDPLFSTVEDYSKDLTVSKRFLFNIINMYGENI